MALTWINEARANLSVASNNYAKIQKELDKYNKLFQTYAFASPETQIRAASVMRQALNEYNSLKAQQEDNAIRLYTAQNWVNYYSNIPNDVPSVGDVSTTGQELNIVPWVEIDSGTYQQEPIIQNEVVSNSPAPISNTANLQNVANDIALNATNETPVGRYLANLNNQNRVWYQSTPVSAQNIVSTKISKFPNTTLNQNTSSWANTIRTNPYGQWNIASWTVSTINSGSALVNTWRRFDVSNRRRFI